MSTIKDKNGMDLMEAEDIKKRWQEYTEVLYKKDLHALGANIVSHCENMENLRPTWTFP